ncbi:carboxymuconolactone decarboxylase family protein [Streptomyces sp. 5K101]|uniref:carboxymuconolactone decarboxylase family protein n=1 Tax=Streptomyces sp. 5K101 TaxID=3390037 RepID=UPI003975C0B4
MRRSASRARPTAAPPISTTAQRATISGRHVPLAKASGLPDTDIDRIVQGSEAGGWTDLERWSIRAADERNRDARLGEATWEALVEHFGDEEMIEITMLVGQYHMVALFLNSVGVELDPGFDSAGLPEGNGTDE